MLQTEFVLYDMSTAQITFRVDCGGGHRNWDIGQSDDNLLFAYIKDKKTHLISKMVKPPCQTIRVSMYVIKEHPCQLVVRILLNHHSRAIPVENALILIHEYTRTFKFNKETEVNINKH